MSVYGAEITESERFEEVTALQQESFEAGDRPRYGIGETRQGAQHLLRGLFEAVVTARCGYGEQVTVERPYVGVYRHVVVIEYHQQIARSHPGVVYAFESESAGHGTVAYHHYGFALLAFEAKSSVHAQCRRYGYRRVPASERVVFALGTFREPAQAA